MSKAASPKARKRTGETAWDPVRLEIYKHLFHSIAEEMGAALKRTAFSPNIKERRDYSCALFGPQGEVVAMGDHMPVHLGSMPMSVAAAIHRLHLESGDVAMLNDPYAGGTHLPDITLVKPVFAGKTRRPAFYVASRAHHADVGGAFAGSMGIAREIYQEGFRIPPVKLMRRGVVDNEILALLQANVRTPLEREGDLKAQIAACNTGESRLHAAVSRYGIAELHEYTRHLNDYAAALLQQVLISIPKGTYKATDYLDDDGVTEGAVVIEAAIHLWSEGSRRKARVSFDGSSAQRPGSINGVFAIAFSAVYYVFRCLAAEEVPACAGLMRDIEVSAPAGSVVNARPPAAVAGGNVELSQRIVDVLLRALGQAIPGRIPAASSGTMNNLTIGGVDPRRRQPFTYYETIAGGMGARPTADGVSGVHTHMTNSLNTPVEVLESEYPFRVRQYGLRERSGGDGRFRGGDGIVREIELLTDAEVNLLSDRRQRGPYGLAGGGEGLRGRNLVVAADGSEREVPGKIALALKRGDAVRIETPGGGGWGAADERDKRP